MLELRSTCEHCSASLPPSAQDARICSYECTFCARCVEHVLHNVCPNCGGGFVPRPIRPARNWVNGNFLGRHPATSKVTSAPVDQAAFEFFSTAIRVIPPCDR
ncbi:MAG TPA: DUF1272 domain-containing protein [Telluria sp.]|nr:DUF1272 domain-containing protein [Telluria sp.]